MKLKEWMRDMTTDDLREAAADILMEIHKRAADEGDPAVLLEQAFDEGFDASGMAKNPFLIGPYIAIPGIVSETGKTRHTCKLATVTLPDDAGASWCWNEEALTYVSSDQAKIGSVRRSIALHSQIDGLIVAVHSMSWDGERHSRSSTGAWEYYSDDGLRRVKNYHPGHLPPPHGDDSKTTNLRGTRQ